MRTTALTIAEWEDLSFPVQPSDFNVPDVEQQGFSFVDGRVSARAKRRLYEYHRALYDVIQRHFADKNYHFDLDHRMLGAAICVPDNARYCVLSLLNQLGERRAYVTHAPEYAARLYTLCGHYKGKYNPVRSDRVVDSVVSGGVPYLLVEEEAYYRLRPDKNEWDGYAALRDTQARLRKLHLLLPSPVTPSVIPTRLVAGTTYFCPEGADPVRCRDAYLRRLLEVEAPETWAYMQRFAPRQLELLDVALLPDSWRPDAAENTEHVFTYFPGLLGAVPHRVRFAVGGTAAAYRAEPSSVEVYEIVHEQRVAQDLRNQVSFAERLDLYAPLMRGIILDDFFLNGVDIYAVLRTQVCFTPEAAARAAANFCATQDPE